MEVTGVRIKGHFGDMRIHRQSPTRLVSFASIDLDNCLAIHGLRIIDGEKGMFVAFPNEKKRRPCLECRRRCAFDDAYCGGCGAVLPVVALDVAAGERAFLDTVHPITSELRTTITAAVMTEYAETVEKERRVVG